MRIKNVLVSAPMANLTTPAFRCIIEDFGGCDLYFSEMINAASLLTGGAYEAYYVCADPVPDKLIHQIVGGEPEPLWRAGEYLDTLPGLGIDINMGCCAPEIIRARAGIYWMRSLAASRKLVAGMRKRVKRKLLSVKLRLGEQEDGETLLSFCKALEEEGIDFLTLHPRTRKDKFSRLARWEYIKLLKQEVRIPIIGNGDVKTYEDYQRVMQRFQPDGVMLGRAALRSPWIFSWIRLREEYERGGERGKGISSFTVDLLRLAQRFFDLLPRYQPPDFLESRTKRFFRYFIENLTYGHHLYSRLCMAPDWLTMKKWVEEYFSTHPEERLRSIKFSLSSERF
ncbi:MAG: tRNA-dihydrouridine synthase family protein [Spirochaetales bacterium]